ncbi:MAG: hypothetical protein DRH93_10860 [Deltaproteobacteria bacterium]|nr:MAG: hypothetical protein DRH93_10860 [Deltaproteobacteria bacterium]
MRCLHSDLFNLSALFEEIRKISYLLVKAALVTKFCIPHCNMEHDAGAVLIDLFSVLILCRGMDGSPFLAMASLPTPFYILV